MRVGHVDTGHYLTDLNVSSSIVAMHIWEIVCLHSRTRQCPGIAVSYTNEALQYPNKSSILWPKLKTKKENTRSSNTGVLQKLR